MYTVFHMDKLIPQKGLTGKNQLEVLSIEPEIKKHNTPLVFVPMSWGTSAVFMVFMRFFAGKGYRCFSLSLRGHGESKGRISGATMENYVSDVHEVVNNFALEKPVIVGHSMGGLIALMYGAQYDVAGVVALDSSPPLEVQGAGEEKVYPKEYTPLDAGMPTDQESIMAAFPDIETENLRNLKKMLGTESGVARSQRKKGISVPKEAYDEKPLLFIGSGNGTSVPFGIGIDSVRAQADYYEAPLAEIKEASHPGLIMGTHWNETVLSMIDWLENNHL